MPRAGIVTLCGRPNAGKSTLLNRIVGEKLSIISPKPQSTRDRIVGIHTIGDDVQMVLLDTPGLLEPTYTLQQAMRRAARRALADADVIVYLADVTEGEPAPLAAAAGLDAPPRAPVIVALNKSDRLPPARRTAIPPAPDRILISATTGEGVAELLDAIARRLPESPFLYPADELSTQHLRFFVAEFVRETALEQLEDEVPYSLACQVEEFREDRSPVYIRATMYVERESQKRILIGAKGARIRAIGQAARRKIEILVGGPVYLDLWVKVLHNWRRDANAMRRLGYSMEETSG